jgi:hypothetical protein
MRYLWAASVVPRWRGVWGFPLQKTATDHFFAAEQISDDVLAQAARERRTTLSNVFGQAKTWSVPDFQGLSAR